MHLSSKAAWLLLLLVVLLSLLPLVHLSSKAACSSVLMSLLHH